MGLETTTFISGLTAAWPLAGDNKSQGDDHIRLLKATLQSTFPGASKAFYFPTVEAISGTLTLDATDQNNIVTVDTTAGSVTVNLPSTLAVADKGWTCEVVKTSNDANAAIVTPAAGTIATKCGSVATVRVGILCEPARFIWSGSAWIGTKPGPMIGSTENFDGVTTPPGYLDAYGATYSNTAFAELFAVLATTTLRDKRGRNEVGLDTGALRLTTAGSGIDGTVLGAAGGAQIVTLARTDLPNVAPTFTGTLGSATSTNSNIPVNASKPVGFTTGTGNTPIFADVIANLASSFTPAGTVQSLNGNVTQTTPTVVQPTIVVKKIIRAC